MYNENINETDDEISLLELWSIFKNRFLYFFITLLIVMVIAFTYTESIVPQYSTSITILVDPINSSSSLDSMLLSNGSNDKSKMQATIELITSNKNIQEALDSLDLTSYKNSKGQSYDTFYKVSENSENVIVTTVKGTNIVSLSITDENPIFAADLANALSNSYDNMLTEIARTSKATQKQFLEQQIPLNDAKLKQAITNLDNFTKYDTLEKQIAFFDNKEEPLKLNKINKDQIIKYYEKELERYSITLPPTYSLNFGDVYKELNNAYSNANTELLMYNLAYEKELTGSTSNPDYLNKITVLINAKDSISNKMLDEINKTVFKYSTGDKYVTNILIEYSKATLEIVKDDIELFALDEKSKIYKDELAKLPLIQGQEENLENKVSLYQQTGLDLLSTYQKLNLTEAAISSNITVFDKAEIPKKPISPNKLLLMIIGLLIGFVLGFFMCIIAHLLDNSVNTRDDVKKAVGENIPLLGWIPLIRNDNNKTDIENFSDFTSIPVIDAPTSLRAEKYMSITSNILYGKTLLNNQIMSITSCDKSSGKSSSISNIGLCLAQRGAKVIIIDGDFRMPSVLSIFGYSRTKEGCVDVVLGKSNLEDVIVQPISTFENLHILPVGHKTQVPSSILAHPKFSEMLKVLKEHYDYILIDAPPLTYASEVLSIGKMSDTILINVRAGITPKDSLKELIIDLDTIKDKINGVILNGFIPSTTDHGGLANGKDEYGYCCNYYKSNKNKKFASQSKAKRIEIKTYKKDINKRLIKDNHFEHLNKYPKETKNLNFGYNPEQFNV